MTFSACLKIVEPLLESSTPPTRSRFTLAGLVAFSSFQWPVGALSLTQDSDSQLLCWQLNKQTMLPHRHQHAGQDLDASLTDHWVYSQYLDLDDAIVAKDWETAVIAASDVFTAYIDSMMTLNMPWNLFVRRAKAKCQLLCGTSHMNPSGTAILFIFAELSIRVYRMSATNHFVSGMKTIS